MLPDFIDVKRKLGIRDAGVMARGARDGPVLSQPRTYRQHEGDSYTLNREDGSSETRSFRRTEVTVQVTAEDIQTRGFEAVGTAIGAIQGQLREASTEQFFEEVTASTDAVGNTFHAGGKPFDVEMIFEMLEKMELSFDENGEWEQPTMLGPPEFMPRIEAEFRRLEETPELRARRDALVARKRKEWIDREADRKLVD